MTTTDIYQKISFEETKKSDSFFPFELKIWDCQISQLEQCSNEQHAFAHWVLSWNTNDKVFIEFQEQRQEMASDKVYLISPNTLHSKWITTNNNQQIKQTKPHQSLSIHFNLGIPLDWMPPAIYTISLTPCQQKRLLFLFDQLTKNNQPTIQCCFHIQSLVFEFLSLLNFDSQTPLHIDSRILQITQKITQNLSQNYTNDELASFANMATNSFSRLFKKQMKMSVQHFIKSEKIKLACKLLDRKEISIEKVAHNLGFSDRYHFSRIFKQLKNCSPGQYSQRHTDCHQ
ncbi:helix-turn-helix domain-containing protein [Capnocytophaga canimorsus]|uniref:helix-turn-helix domain-containing protein n=1 Tax=Capnocytophaga canimorsus TaxID=28188 RepID=UPI0037D50835